MQLVDYKVRVVNARAGTAARVRVVIEIARRRRRLGHRRRQREHHRGELAGAGRRHRVQAVQGRTEHPARPQPRRRSRTSTRHSASVLSVHRTTDRPRMSIAELPKQYDPQDAQRRWLRLLGRAGLLPRRPGEPEAAVHHRHPAAERDRRPAHGPRPQQHAAGRAHPLAADAGLQRPVDARHRPRRHRHAGGGREAALRRRRRRPATTSAARSWCERIWAVEGPVRGPHPRPAPADSGCSLRLGAHALHARRRCCAGPCARRSSTCSATATSTAASGW